MGGIWCQSKEIISSTADIVGYKSGLALSIDQLKLYSSDEYQYLFSDNQDRIIRIRAEEYEIFLAHILYKLGVISTDNISSFVISLYHIYKNDENSFATFFEQIITLYVLFKYDLSFYQGKDYIPFPSELKKKGITEVLLDIATFIPIFIHERVTTNEFILRKELFIASVKKSNQYKRDEILEALLIGLTDYVQRSPWLSYRCVPWKDTRELSDLFESEQLHSYHGEFFDQRFINYLSSQYDDIGRIHWRQFEGLATEFLHREDFKVEIGRGRNDDSIDIRAWKNKDAQGVPPTLLVQCKRQKEKVGKVVVKALWADIEHEKAQSGLIVTSSALEPGAKKTQVARSYPIVEINRETLRTWIMKMRTPWSGIIMFE